nr:PilC/PilY family type IV pilus protein [Halothiobacillus sp.]
TLDPAFRLGFGSINGRNTGGLPTPTYGFSTSTNSSNKLAEVEPIGDGTSGTQKANFWSWLVGEAPNNSTPLRGALNAVGQYYQTAQPWQTSDTDTTAYACRQSYAILTTDGFWNGSTPANIGNQDGTAGNTNLGSASYQVALPYSDSQSDTLADVAMKYWKTDLRTGLANEVPTSPRDPANWQHMVTFTVGLGFDPTGITPSTITVPQIFDWAQTGGTPPAGVTSSNFSWPTPSSNSINNSADLAHAGVNGHGAFVSAKSPDQFQKAITNALNAAGNGPGSSNSITLSGTQTPTTGSSNSLMQFRATFYTGQWTSTLTGAQYDPTTGTYVQQWNAGSQLPAAASRNIWTSKLSSGANTSVEFKLATNLSTAELAGLDYYLNGVKQTSVLDQTVLDYLRGDTTYEQANVGGIFRTRAAPLGDIVSSTPVLIDAPSPTLFENGVFPGASTYSSFVTAKSGRLPLLYVAGNDGMLHAFRVTQGYLSDGVTQDPNAMAGREVYAYIPAAVLRQTGDARISNLANPEYGAVNGITKAQAVPHQYYNDGRITTQNVYFSSDSSWHTILVGTTGRGPAKAIYAMDITDPSVLLDPTKASQALLWERSADDGLSTNDAYIGEMTGAPVIGQIKVGGTNSWAVFIGNGYNSAKNQAALLQFDLKTGALTVNTTDATTDNGLAEPGLMQPDVHNEISTLAFAGDLYGNIWKFDLSSATAPGTKIYQAKDSVGAVQPVTSLVALTYDDRTKSTWALFGTGKYLTSSDVKTTQVQTWYGLRVDVAGSSTGTTNAPVVQATDSRTNLTQRSIVAEVAGPNSTINRATSVPTSATDMEKKSGWYMDLNTQTGERIVNRTQFIGSLAVVTTLIPKATDPCNPYPGGAVMLVDPYTGANSNSILGDFNGDGVINSSDGTTVGGKLVPFNGKVFTVGAAAGVTGSYDANGKTVSLSFNKLDGSLDTLGPLNIPGDAPGRISWRELINY